MEKNQTVNDMIKKDDLNAFITLFNKEESVLSFVNEIASFAIKESYFQIDHNGIVKAKKYNKSFLLINLIKKVEKANIITDFQTFSNNTLSIIFQELKDNKNRIKMKKIDRLSNVELPILKKNFFKTAVKSEVKFSIRAGHELFLRDKNSFFEILALLGLVNYGNDSNPLKSSYKALYAFETIELLSAAIEHKKEFLIPALWLSISFIASAPTAMEKYVECYSLLESSFKQIEPQNSIEQNLDFGSFVNMLKAKNKETLINYITYENTDTIIKNTVQLALLKAENISENELSAYLELINRLSSLAKFNRDYKSDIKMRTLLLVTLQYITNYLEIHDINSNSKYEPVDYAVSLSNELNSTKNTNLLLLLSSFLDLAVIYPELKGHCLKSMNEIAKMVGSIKS